MSHQQRLLLINPSPPSGVSYLEHLSVYTWKAQNAARSPGNEGIPELHFWDSRRGNPHLALHLLRIKQSLIKKAEHWRIDAFDCGVGEDSRESLGLQGDPTSPSQGRSVLSVQWKDWCWSWNSNTLATWCKVLTHLKRLWCCERLRAGREGDNRGWDGWMASPTQWTWVDSGSWWWTGRPGVLQSMGLQRVRHNWVTELNWTESNLQKPLSLSRKLRLTSVSLENPYFNGFG